jgi:hypothetical protein
MPGRKKYSEKNAFKLGITSWPNGVDGNLIAAAMAASSWLRHSASLNCFRKFCSSTGTKFSWPIPAEIAQKFTSWAIRTKNLSADTTKVYISDLKLAHRLRNLHCPFENDVFIPLMLKGAKNLATYKDICKLAKFVMSFHLLKIISHEIAKSDWDKDNKLVVWSACCVAFFGSFRLRELLPQDSLKGSLECLRWNQVTFTQKIQQ